MDRHRHNRLNPRASDLRSPRLDPLPHPHATQLQEHDLSRLCFAAAGRNLRRDPRPHRIQMGKCHACVRIRRGSLAIPMAERRDKLRHHGRHLPDSWPFRQVSQYEMGCSGWAGCDAICLGVTV